MVRVLLMAAASCVLLLAACSQAPPAQQTLDTPWTGVARGGLVARGSARVVAGNLIADNDVQFLRSQRTAEGVQPLAQLDSYIDRTFDVQAIGGPQGRSWRYHYEVQSGVGLPTAP